MEAGKVKLGLNPDRPGDNKRSNKVPELRAELIATSGGGYNKMTPDRARDVSKSQTHVTA